MPALRVTIEVPDKVGPVLGDLPEWLARYGARLRSWTVLRDPDPDEERGPAVDAE